jgi:SagB-type dehydrogenase family enzyme
MRKNIITLALLALMATACKAQDIHLPAPSMANKVSLLEALQNRHSAREYSDKDIPADVLSTVLWAACGINRPDQGKITAPSAVNAQDITVFVVRKDGAYRYEPKDNKLVKVSGKDLRRAVAGRQDFAATAPVSLVMASRHSKFPSQLPAEAKSRLGVIDAGYVSENICLVCSALGLNTVPRMTMDTDSLRKELALDDSNELIVNNQIGYPKE